MRGAGIADRPTVFRPNGRRQHLYAWRARQRRKDRVARQLHRTRMLLATMAGLMIGAEMRPRRET